MRSLSADFSRTPSLLTSSTLAILCLQGIFDACWGVICAFSPNMSHRTIANSAFAPIGQIRSRRINTGFNAASKNLCTENIPADWTLFSCSTNTSLPFYCFQILVNAAKTCMGRGGTRSSPVSWGGSASKAFFSSCYLATKFSAVVFYHTVSYRTSDTAFTEFRVLRRCVGAVMKLHKASVFF